MPFDEQGVFRFRVPRKGKARGGARYPWKRPTMEEMEQSWEDDRKRHAEHERKMKEKSNNRTAPQ